MTRLLHCLLIGLSLLVPGCVTKSAPGLSRESAEAIALQALQKQGFRLRNDYRVSAKRHKGEWELRFEFEPRIPGSSMLIWVDDRGTARILPANF